MRGCIIHTAWGVGRILTLLSCLSVFLLGLQGPTSIPWGRPPAEGPFHGAQCDVGSEMHGVRGERSGPEFYWPDDLSCHIPHPSVPWPVKWDW